MYYILFDDLYKDWNIMLKNGLVFGDEWISSYETEEEAKKVLKSLNEDENK